MEWLIMIIGFLMGVAVANLLHLTNEKEEDVNNCTCKLSTGWTEMPCCNICGKQVEVK